MKKMIFLLLACVCTIIAFATAQMSESMHYNGKWYGMFSLPLEQHAKIGSIRTHIPDIWNTGLYRCYRGYWSIRNDSLFLDSIGYPDKNGLCKYDLSKELGGTTPLFASWVNDTLHLIDGKCIFYVHDAWLSKFENDSYLNVIDGKVKGIRTSKNEIINPERPTQEVNEIINQFVKDNLPWLERNKRIVIQAKYVETDSLHNPTHTRINIIRDDAGMTDMQRQDLIDKLDCLMIKERLIPAAWAEGELYCFLYSFIIIKH